LADFLLDTNHVGALLRENSVLWSKLRAHPNDRFGVCRPSVGELWFMVFNSVRIEENRSRLETLLSQFKIWEYDEPAAMEFGRIRAEIRQRGTPIPTIDVQIAATARSYGLVVLSSDAHFLKVGNLRVENWLPEAGSC
jgi:tRNA(fMet)-specific endonuclease VapC